MKYLAEEILAVDIAKMMLMYDSTQDLWLQKSGYADLKIIVESNVGFSHIA